MTQVQTLEDIQRLRGQLQALQAGQLSIAVFSEQARAMQTLLAALPEAFTQVLHNILDRLESSALFTEESCSFSQTGLFDNLTLWLDKAEQRLTQTS